MRIKCDNCGKQIHKKPSVIKLKNYCNKECRREDKHYSLQCKGCGKFFQRLKCQTPNPAVTFCSNVCAKNWRKNNFSELAKKLNPTRMTLEVRTKLRKYRLGKGKGVSYPKTFGVHTHRIIAEQKLGRKLKKR